MNDPRAQLAAIMESWRRGLEVFEQQKTLDAALSDLESNFRRLELDYPGLGKDAWWVAFKQQIIESYERVRPELPEIPKF